VGLPLLARVEAHKAGHALHTQLVSNLLADPTLWTITTEDGTPAENTVLAAVPEQVPAAD